MLQRNLYHCKSPHMFNMKDKGFMQISMNLFFQCKPSHIPSFHHSYNNKVLFYVLLLQSGAHSPLHKEQNTVKTNLCKHTYTHACTHTLQNPELYESWICNSVLSYMIFIWPAELSKDQDSMFTCACWILQHLLSKLTKSKSSFSTVSTVAIFPENFLARKEATSLWQSFLQAT